MRRMLLVSCAAAAAARSCGVTQVYHPSVADVWWRQNIDRVVEQRNITTAGCRALRQHRRVVADWLALWRQRESALTPREQDRVDMLLRNGSLGVPFFHVADSCRGTTTLVPIEPLVGWLRHPLWLCDSQPHSTPDPHAMQWHHHRQDKDYMFPLHAAEVFPKLIDPQMRVRRGRAFLFDLGCSSYGAGPGGASQSWFVNTYLKRGIKFDRILAWEAKLIDPAKVFAGYPPEVLDVLSFYNVPVNSDPASLHNPLRVLRSICTPADFVVLKIDIDTANIESALLAQLLGDHDVLARVDELYWEHHVERHPLSTSHPGWGNTVYTGMRGKDFGFTRLKGPPTPRGLDYTPGPVVRKDNDITASYEIFNILREHGIRAHSWV